MQHSEITTPYRVNCECDKWIPVTLNQLGADVYCQCGRRVVIPHVDQFREEPDQISSITLERRVSRLVALGKLPPRECCARCGAIGNTAVTPIRLECERSKNRSGGGERFLYLPFLFFISWQEEEWSSTVGRDTEVNTPLCLCQPCRTHLRGRSRRFYFGLKLFFLLLGIVLAFANIFLGSGVALVGMWSVSIWKGIELRKRRTELKKYLSKISAYQDVLRGYPHAVAIISPESAIQSEP